MGDLIVRPGWTGEVMAPELRGEGQPCPDYNTLGRFCGSDECTCKHKPIKSLPREKKDLQIRYVDANRDSIRFNAKTVRYLPQDKQYLLQDPAGGAAGETSGR